MLKDLLCIRPGITAVIGGGGKTSLIRRLARELAPDSRVIVTTTTRIYPPEGICTADGEPAAALLRQHGIVCAARPAEEGKLQSPALSMAEMCAMADYVLVEADGSRGLPLKAHLPHEPVIPEGCENVICVLGGDGFGRPARQVCHRYEVFCRLAGTAPDAPVTEEHAARVLEAEGLHTRVFLNKLDQNRDAADRLAALLRCPGAAGSLQEGWYLCLH